MLVVKLEYHVQAIHKSMIQHEIIIIPDHRVPVIMDSYSIQVVAVLGFDLSVVVVLQFLSRHLVSIIVVVSYPAGTIIHYQQRRMLLPLEQYVSKLMQPYVAMLLIYQ